MIKVGITGGIGSGKTTVCKVFETFGVPIFYADKVARFLQDTDNEVIDSIKCIFGNNVYDDNGKLNRPKIGSIVFNNRELLEKLKQIIHPKVHEAFEKWTTTNSTFAYNLYEAAILFESGIYTNFDLNILVIADQKLRIERVMQRDGLTEASILSRIANQMLDSEKKKMADYIIFNNKSDLIIPQIVKLDDILKNYGKVW